MEILESITLDWFLKLPGLFITGGVVLILIALIVFIIGSHAEKKKLKNESNLNIDADNAGDEVKIMPTMDNMNFGVQNNNIGMEPMVNNETPAIEPVIDLKEVSNDIPEINLEPIKSTENNTISESVTPINNMPIDQPTIVTPIEKPVEVSPVEPSVNAFEPITPQSVVNTPEVVQPAPAAPAIDFPKLEEKPEEVVPMPSTPVEPSVNVFEPITPQPVVNTEEVVQPTPAVSVEPSVNTFEPVMPQPVVDTPEVVPTPVAPVEPSVNTFEPVMPQPVANTEVKPQEEVVPPTTENVMTPVVEPVPTETSVKETKEEIEEI